MRKIYFLLALCLFSMSVKGQSLTPEVLYYDFNGTGTTVPNLASNPPAGTANATVQGALSLQSNGICAGSLQGSGNASSTDFLNTGWAPNIGTGAWTISFRSQGISNNATLYYVFGDGGTASFRCFTNGVAGANNFILRGAGLTDVLANNSALPTPTMTTFVYDPALANCKAYVNGVLVNTVAQGAVNLTGTGPFKVMGYSSNVGAPAGGLMDDYRVYSRALSASEVAALYAGGTTAFLGPDQDLCAGDTLTLSSSATTGSFLWSTGDTTSTIMVNAAGMYSLSISSTCVNGTDTIQINNAPALPSAGFAGADTSVCLGQTAMLTASGGTSSLLWSTGDTTNSVTVGIGSYEVTATNICGSITDTVEVMQTVLNYSGYVYADSTSAACEGDTLMLGSLSQFDSYLWSTGDTTSSIWVTSSGTYSLSVMDACGSGTDSIMVSFIAPVNASFSSSLNQFTASFTNSSTGGGTLSYSWDFGDGNSSTSASPSHTYAANGTYAVSMTVSNECGSMTVTDSVTVFVIAISPSMELGLQAYPNPARDLVVLKAELSQIDVLNIELSTLQGQVVMQQRHENVAGSFNTQLNTSKLAAGTYFLRASTGQGQQVLRLVIE